MKSKLETYIMQNNFLKLFILMHYYYVWSNTFIYLATDGHSSLICYYLLLLVLIFLIFNFF